MLDIRQDGHALLSLMIVLAIDAAKCSGNGVRMQSACSSINKKVVRRHGSGAWMRIFEGIIEAGKGFYRKETDIDKWM